MTIFFNGENCKKRLCFFSHTILFFSSKNCNYTVKIKLNIKKIKLRKLNQKSFLLSMETKKPLISEIATRYGFSLFVSGRSYKILCPFHNEKTPSLLLNDERGTYHCFGCGTSGNIYTLFKYLNSTIDFKKEYCSKDRQRENMSLEKKIFRSLQLKEKYFFSKLTSSKCLWILQLSWGFFVFNLRINNLLKILVYSRGISVYSSKIYGLGFAPRKKNELFRFLKDSGLKLTDIFQSGMIYSKIGKNNIKISIDSQKNYDRNFSDVFRHRLVIPIRNKYGIIIGFGGRIISKIKIAKYINSSDSNLFKKKRILFSEEIISTASKGFFRTLIVTEGYMDSIGLFQNGIKFTSASLGTSIGNFQLERLHLNSYNYHIMVYFDADIPGKIATKKILSNTIENLIENYFCISIANIEITENTKDPDEFVYYRGSVNLTENIFNCSLPIIKWYENNRIIEMKKLFLSLFYSIQLNTKTQVLFDGENNLMDMNAFILLLKKITKLQKNSFESDQILYEIVYQQSTVPRFGAKNETGIHTGVYLFDNKKFDHIRYFNKSKDNKNLIFLNLLLFPAFRDDLIQIFSLNEFFFLDYNDKCLYKSIYNTVFNIRLLITWVFYETICTHSSMMIGKPGYLKDLFLFYFDLKDYFSVDIQNKPLMGNSTFSSFFLSFLVFKKKKVNERIKIIKTQIVKLKFGVESIKKEESRFFLNILCHRKIRFSKYLKIFNQKKQ